VRRATVVRVVVRSGNRLQLAVSRLVTLDSCETVSEFFGCGFFFDLCLPHQAG
jgi:hypothetical protein